MLTVADGIIRDTTTRSALRLPHRARAKYQGKKKKQIVGIVVIIMSVFRLNVPFVIVYHHKKEYYHILHRILDINEKKYPRQEMTARGLEYFTYREVIV